MRRGFGELELLILEVLSVKDVMQKLPGDNKYTTIMTVMNRLTEKKVLARQRMGLHYNYTILNSSTKIPSLIQQFIQKIFGLNTTKLDSHLIDVSSEMTEDELNELSQLFFFFFRPACRFMRSPCSSLKSFQVILERQNNETFSIFQCFGVGL